MIDEEKVRELLMDWQPGDNVDDDSLVESALRYYLDGEPLPPELSVS
jgi:hypothetical protein